MTKKRISILLSLALLALLFTWKPETAEAEEAPRLSILTTIFPEYDWVREILGAHADNAEVTLLLDSGVDLHNYQPTVTDLVKLANCDLFIYVGGESDAWVEDALKNAVNENMKVIRLLDVLGDDVKTEESIEGMQDAHSHETEEGHEDDHESEDGHAEAHSHGEADEHVWLSLKNAQVLCRAISEAIGELDPEHRDDYAVSTAAYLEKLEALDGKFRQAVENGTHRTLLFGDRFPFRYLVDDYGLSYYAAFSGCSAESEASFETVSFLAKKLDELGLPCVLTIEGTQHRIAQTIVQNTAGKNQSVLTLDSMQSVTARDAESGVTYLSIMERNLDVLKQALG